MNEQRQPVIGNNELGGARSAQRARAPFWGSTRAALAATALCVVLVLHGAHAAPGIAQMQGYIGCNTGAGSVCGYGNCPIPAAWDCTYSVGGCSTGSPPGTGVTINGTVYSGAEITQTFVGLWCEDGIGTRVWTCIVGTTSSPCMDVEGWSGTSGSNACKGAATYTASLTQNQCTGQK